MLQVAGTQCTAQVIPELFCWTKYGTEAGEGIGAILARKETERLSNGGMFLWGIGNAVGPSVATLLVHTSEPQVVFTPMRARPAARDISPTLVAVWHRGIGLDGVPFELPRASCVTSRLSPKRRYHYALVCRSEQPLCASSLGGPSFASTQVRNLRSGSNVGASQVTAVVRRIASASSSASPRYAVSFGADLVAPYFVRLTDYSLVPTSAQL